MASTAAPFGAISVGTLAGGMTEPAVTPIKIASGYATSIFEGDFLKLAASGTVEKDTGTTTLTPIGIFKGCEYTDPNSNQLVQSNYWPASTVASDAVAFVVIDPNATFIMQADDALVQADLGNNAAIVQTAGSTANGRSKNALDASTAATTSTLPLRILAFANDSQSDSYPEVICMFNSGDHQLDQPTGTGT
jgi:hypothetical protein